ncbi:MAG: hypothetical protein HY342_01405 [Candidatus Lambdaproteobacteria bacterium]|nr:hypothetical protein [Candidatus Lambdaproteobacteria bacterium]
MNRTPRCPRVFHAPPACRGRRPANRRAPVAGPVLLALALVLTAAAPRALLALGAPQRIGFYGDALSRPLDERIAPADEAILDWQHRINLQYEQDVRPRTAAPDNPLIPRVRRMVAELPPGIRALAGQALVGLYLVEDDWGSGSTEAVQDAAGRWRYSYVALNLTALDKTGNAWGTWKDRSTFTPAPGHDLRMTLERPGEDSVDAAIRFIFLHELGHVVGLARQAHGFWDAETLPAATRESPFVTVSWRVDAGGAGQAGQANVAQPRMVSRWQVATPLLSQLGFYAFDKAPLSMTQAEPVYRALAQTDFPSLYGATNLFDDWAEAFAIYVHTALLGRPYQVEVLRDGQVVFTYRSCMVTGGCPAKVAALKAVLGLE